MTLRKAKRKNRGEPKGSPHSRSIITFAQLAKSANITSSKLIWKLNRKDPKTINLLTAAIQQNVIKITSELYAELESFKKKGNKFRSVVEFSFDDMFIGIEHKQVQALMPAILKEISGSLRLIASLSRNAYLYVLPTLRSGSVAPMVLHQIMTASQTENFMNGLNRVYLKDWGDDTLFTEFSYSADQVVFKCKKDLLDYALTQGYAVLQPLSYITKGYKKVNQVRSGSALHKLQRAWRGKLVVVTTNKQLTDRQLAKLNSLVCVLKT